MRRAARLLLATVGCLLNADGPVQTTLAFESTSRAIWRGLLRHPGASGALAAEASTDALRAVGWVERGPDGNGLFERNVAFEGRHFSYELNCAVEGGFTWMQFRDGSLRRECHLTLLPGREWYPHVSIHWEPVQRSTYVRTWIAGSLPIVPWELDVEVGVGAARGTLAPYQQVESGSSWRWQDAFGRLESTIPGPCLLFLEVSRPLWRPTVPDPPRPSTMWSVGLRYTFLSR